MPILESAPFYSKSFGVAGLILVYGRRACQPPYACPQLWQNTQRSHGQEQSGQWQAPVNSPLVPF